MLSCKSATTIDEVFLWALTAQTYTDIIRKYTRDKDTFDEFRQFIHLILLENPEKTVTAFNDGFFKWHFIKIVTNQVLSNDSPWHIKYRKTKHDSLDDHKNLGEEEERDLSNIYNDIDQVINIKITEKPILILNFNLWRMYHLQHLTYQQISKKTQIPYSSIRNYIEKATVILNKELKSKYLN